MPSCDWLKKVSNNWINARILAHRRKSCPLYYFVGVVRYFVLFTMVVCVTSSGFDKLLVDHHRCMTVMTSIPKFLSRFSVCVSAMRWVWPDCSVDGEERGGEESVFWPLSQLLYSPDGAFFSPHHG